MAHLTDAHSIKKNVRAVSQHVDDTRINIYIDEAEQMNVKGRIGDALYVDLLKYIESEERSEFPASYEILLKGGIYDSGGSSKIFKGLQATVDYYAYARLVKNNDNTVTRFGGSTIKDDQYSHHAELRVKLAAEKDALIVADRYMAEVIEFLSSRTDIPLYVNGKAKNRLNITIIGQ